MSKLMTVLGKVYSETLFLSHPLPVEAVGRLAPPTYAPDSAGGSSKLSQGEYVNEAGEVKEHTVLASEGAMTNQLEAVIKAGIESGEIQIPHVKIDTTGYEDEFGNVRELWTLDLPHRLVDSKLSHTTHNGTPFQTAFNFKTFGPRRIKGLFELDPATVLFGVWNSYSPNNNFKIPRSIQGSLDAMETKVSEEWNTMMDVINLESGSVILYEKADSSDGHKWTTDVELAKLNSDKKPVQFEKISNTGMGHIPNSEKGKKKVSFKTIQGSYNISVGNLKSFGGWDNPKQKEAACKYLIALGMYAVASLPQSWFLRSGCTLSLSKSQFKWAVGELQAPEWITATKAECIEALNACVEEMKNAGIQWNTEPVIVKPDADLIKLVQTALGHKRDKVKSTRKKESNKDSK